MYSSIIFITCITLSAAQRSEIWRVTKFPSVTHFEGIESFYVACRQRVILYVFGPLLGIPTHPKEPEDATIRAQFKEAICEHIFESHFFRMHRVDWIDTSKPDTREELRNNHRTIFYSIFEDSPSTPSGYVYENAYTQRRIHISDVEQIEDYVIKCLGKDRQTETIKEYFVSRAYDVNLNPTSASRFPVAGRFILEFDETNDVLVMVGLAEQEALTVEILRRSGLVTLGYLWHKSRDELTETPDQDPICSLSLSNKLRLCSSLFSNAALINEVKFLPIIDNVQPNCERKAVSITLLNRFLRRPFEEWVIGCEALNREDHPITYYVSRADEANTIFAFIDAGNQMISIYNLYIMVSVAKKLSTGAGNNAPTDINTINNNPNNNININNNNNNNRVLQVMFLVQPDREIQGERFLRNDVED